MAKNQKLTLSANEGQQHLKPYCKEAKVAAEHKAIAESLRIKATEELRAKLDSDSETKNFKGTVVCIFDDQMYKIRVQRPDSCDWRSKRLNDPNHKAYLALMKEIDWKKKLTSRKFWAAVCNFVAMLVVENVNLMYYMPILGISGAITGAVIGIVAEMIVVRIRKITPGNVGK